MLLGQVRRAKGLATFDPVRRVVRVGRRTNLTGAAVALGLMAGMCLCASGARAQTYKFSVGELSATPIFIEMLKSIEAANPGLKFEITTAPIPRSVKAVVEDHTADFHLPFIRPADGVSLPFDVSTAAVFQAPFVIYENKNKPLDMQNPQQYKIETDKAHTSVFPFPTIPSADIDASLRKVDAGRIDAFIFGASSTDPHLAAGGYTNIHRKPYGRLDACLVLPKGGKGGPADQALTKAVEAAKNTQGYKDAIAKYLALYKGDDWQQQ